MDILTLVLFVLGLGLLVAGAEFLVKGASRLAAAVGVSPLVIGLTVVSFGTSAPELAVSLSAAFTDKADIAAGNVVGSNIFNVLFILGVCAVILPLVVNQQLVRIDVPLMIAVSALTWILCLDKHLGRLDGVILFAGIVGYTVMTVKVGKSQEQQRKQEQAKLQEQTEPQSKLGGPSLLLNIGLIVVGLVLLVLGSKWLVDGAVAVAKAMKVSDLVIGLTIVAAGTSLPEVATSVMAAIRGERDIAVGNVVGSNIFNILGILGLTALIAPSGIAINDSLLVLDIPFMFAVAIGCLPIFFTGHVISRWEGFLFFAYYVAYTIYLLLMANQHDALSTYGTVLFLWVTPIVAVTLVIGLVRGMRQNKS